MFVHLEPTQHGVIFSYLVRTFLSSYPVRIILPERYHIRNKHLPGIVLSQELNIPFRQVPANTSKIFLEMRGVARFRDGHDILL